MALGTLALAAVVLIRHLYPGTQVWAATRPGARAGLAARLGITPLEPWSKRDWLQGGPAVRVIGSNGFGVEEVGGVAKHAFEHYFDLVAQGLDLTPVITHRFPLARWDEAVLALKDSRRTGAVKVLLEPG